MSTPDPRAFDPASEAAPPTEDVLPSLSLILANAQREQDRQAAHFDSLDTKAGLVLGFAGVIVTVSAIVPQGNALTGLLLHVGQALSALSAVLATFSFWPRRYPVIKLLALRAYLAAPAERTRLRLLDTSIAMYEQGATLLQRKAALLGWSLIALVLAVFSLSAGVILRGMGG